MLDKLRSRLARWISPPRHGRRTYAAARLSRLTADWNPANSSADSELVGSLTALRSRSRALVRDASYAKRAKVIVVNNIIGAGVGMQAQVMSARGGLRENVNEAIETAWGGWAIPENCHTGGSLHFCDMERAAMGQVFEAGEVLLRKHYRAFGRSTVPFALELIEAERIADEYAQAGPGRAGGFARMGIELDDFYRPLGYFIRKRHPSEFRLGVYETDMLEWVPADQIIHLRVIDRWPQTRGEPWLHTAAKKLNDMDRYSEAEIVAARGAANYLGVHKKKDPTSTLVTTGAEGERHIDLEPGTVAEIYEEEEFNLVTPNRPNPSMDPFMRMMLREIAAGVGASYESLSRDYSQSNYSSSRLALLDDRDLWKVFQAWWIRNFRLPLHREWLQQAVLARAVPSVNIEEYAADRTKFEAVLFKPRGWSWIDPTKEVAAYKEAVRCGFMTVADVIALTGGGVDLEDILNGRRRELDMMKDKKLVFDTDPDFKEKAAAKAAAPEPGDEEPTTTNDPPRRVVSFGR